MKLSIITPTYNRADSLPNLYKSIVENSKNSNWQIEWLVMDDESIDNTEELIKQYQKEQKIEIYYEKQKNSGKMIAINQILPKATGDFILECDSDDYLTENALEIMQQAVEQCGTLEKIYAIVFLKFDQNGNNMGNSFKQDKQKSTMFDLYFKEGITGEKALLYKADIRKKYKYELENKEKFSTEARLHHKMDLENKVVCFNQPIMICEYKADGYTQNITRIFLQNPYGYFQYFKEIFQHDWKGMHFSKRWYIYKHYIMFAVLTKEKRILKSIPGFFNQFMILISYLPGKIVTEIKWNRKKKGVKNAKRKRRN